MALRYLTACAALLAGTWGALSPAAAAAPELSLGAPFSSEMVLQRGQPIPVWGMAPPGAAITVTLGESQAATAADAAGKWQVELPAMPARNGLALRVSAGKAKLALAKVAIGDVFLCSGQSNMALTMGEAVFPPGSRTMMIDASIRLLEVPKAIARTEQPAFAAPAAWQVAAGHQQGFSAVCLSAGREFARQQGIVIGLVDASLGATPIEGWLPYEGIKLAGGMDEAVAILDAYRADPQAAEARFGRQLDDLWRAPTFGGPDPGPPRLGYSNLFNAMIAPLGPSRYAGAIWYQGENNVRGRPGRQDYRVLLAALLASWRKRFASDLPFAIVQLAPFGPLADEPTDNATSRVREAQRQVAASDPRAELVLTIDIGERLTIHPPLKQPVGVRAAAALSALVYGGDRAALGPQPLAARRAGEDVLVETGGGEGTLMAASWGRPGPFMLCGPAGAPECRFADARFVAGGIAIAIPAGFTPAMVRYCWGAAPLCNVFDRAQHPLGPFELAITAEAGAGTEKQ